MTIDHKKGNFMTIDYRTDGGGRCRKTRRLILLGCLALAVVLATVLAACGGGGTSSSTKPAKPSVAVFITDRTLYTALDPAQEGIGCTMMYNVYETLTRWDDQQNKVVPGLATSWSASPDALTWTFKIRLGVKFHDGSTLTSADVKFSLDRTLKIGQGAYYILLWIKSIETPNASTVVFHLTDPRPMDKLLSALAGPFIYSKAAVQKYGKQCFQPGFDAGSGPYTLKAASLSEVDLERFKDYWGGWTGTHAKYIDTAVIRTVAEPAVRVQQIKAGVAQVVEDIPPTALEGLKSDTNLTLYPKPSWTDLLLWFNTKKKPTDDVNVRAAMTYAYPYRQVLQLVFGGYGAIASSPWAVNTMPGYDAVAAAFPPLTQDLSKAKAFLAKSAYSKGTTVVEYVYSGDDNANKQAQLFKAALAQIGITLSIHQVAHGVMLSEAFTKNPPQGIYTTIAPPSYPNPIDALTYWLHSPPAGSFNLSYYSNPQADKLIDNGYAESATNFDQGINTAIEAYKILARAYPGISAIDLTDVPVVRKEFKGFTGFNPNYPATVRFYDCWLEQ